MKTHIRIEGTPIEIGEILRNLTAAGALQTTAVELVDEPLGPEAAESEMKVVTTSFARRALNRRQLSAPMKAVLQALSKASPGWVSLPELHDIAGYSPAQFAGLLGSFGRRLANTEGYDSEAYFFESRWNDDESTWDYRLPETVLEALTLEELI